MPLSRHQRRILLVQTLFLWEDTTFRRPKPDVSNESREYFLDYIFQEFGEGARPESFDRERFFGIIEKYNEITSLLLKHAPEWPLQKIATHDRAILYLGIFELLFSDVPSPVVINEAVELAKAFGGERSSKFINGVLSSVNKEKIIPFTS